VAQGVGPEFKLQDCKNKFNKIFKRLQEIKITILTFLFNHESLKTGFTQVLGKTSRKKS
jgi:hypothetical protein